MNQQELLNALEAATEGLNEASEGMAESEDIETGEVEYDESTGAPRRIKRTGKLSQKASHRKAKAGVAKASKAVEKAKAGVDLEPRVKALEAAKSTRNVGLGMQSIITATCVNNNPAVPTAWSLRSAAAQIKLYGIRVRAAQESGVIAALQMQGANPVNAAGNLTGMQVETLVVAGNPEPRDIWFNEPVLIDTQVGFQGTWAAVAGAVLTAVLEVEGLSEPAPSAKF